MRDRLSYIIVGVSGIGIIAIGVYAIARNPDNTMSIFNIVLPVFASWVGTVLAFYFGRQTFESASEKVSDMIDRLSPEKRAKALVISIMRPLASMVSFQIEKGKTEADVTVSDLLARFSDAVQRLAIIDDAGRPRYMIHQSSVMAYLVSRKGQEGDSLKQLLDMEGKAGNHFGPDKGFVVVSEGTPIGEAKAKMEGKPPCQDIFVTRGGKPDEPLAGWISNVRLGKYLEA